MNEESSGLLHDEASALQWLVMSSKLVIQLSYDDMLAGSTEVAIPCPSSAPLFPLDCRCFCVFLLV
jgi:hypothetical protein